MADPPDQTDAVTQTPACTIEIQCFGVLRQICGDGNHRVALESGRATVADALDRFAQKFPELREHLGCTACAIGDCFVDRQAALHPGDVLALLPPVSGG